MNELELLDTVREILRKIYLNALNTIYLPEPLRVAVTPAVDKIFDFNISDVVNLSPQELSTFSSNKFRDEFSKAIPNEYKNTEEGISLLFKLDRAMGSSLLTSDFDAELKLLFAQNTKELFEERKYIMQPKGEILSHMDSTIQYMQSHIEKHKPVTQTYSKENSTHKVKPKTKFKKTLTDKQKETLTEFLSHNKYTDNPQQLANFLNGGNVPRNPIAISPDKLKEMAYLLV